MREVGFEPTNPYGTGASGLRFQGPEHTSLFDLAWQHEPPLQRVDSRETARQTPAEETPEDKALIGFPHPKRREKIRITFNSSPAEPVPSNKNPAYPKTRMENQNNPWPLESARPVASEAADVTAGDDRDNTATQECKEDMETPDGNDTAGAASSATDGK